MQNPTWYNNQIHGCCNIAVQSCYFIILWQHVLSCMNMAVDLSWWFQQRCSSLFVHQAMNSLFQHARTSLSTTLFKLASSSMFNLASSTMFKSVNRQKQAVRFYVCTIGSGPCVIIVLKSKAYESPNVLRSLTEVIGRKFVTFRIWNNACLTIW